MKIGDSIMVTIAIYSCLTYENKFVTSSKFFSLTERNSLGTYGNSCTYKHTRPPSQTQKIHLKKEDDHENNKIRPASSVGTFTTKKHL